MKILAVLLLLFSISKLYILFKEDCFTISSDDDDYAKKVELVARGLVFTDVTLGIFCALFIIFGV